MGACAAAPTHLQADCEARARRSPRYCFHCAPEETCDHPHPRLPIRGLGRRAPTSAVLHRVGEDRARLGPGRALRVRTAPPAAGGRSRPGDDRERRRPVRLPRPRGAAGLLGPAARARTHRRLAVPARVRGRLRQPRRPARPCRARTHEGEPHAPHRTHRHRRRPGRHRLGRPGRCRGLRPHLPAHRGRHDPGGVAQAPDRPARRRRQRRGAVVDLSARHRRRPSGHRVPAVGERPDDGLHGR